MSSVGAPSNNPKGRPVGERGPKKRSQITLSAEAKKIMAQPDNPVRAAGWASVSELVEALLVGDAVVPGKPVG